MALRDDNNDSNNLFFQRKPLSKALPYSFGVEKLILEALTTEQEATEETLNLAILSALDQVIPSCSLDIRKAHHDALFDKVLARLKGFQEIAGDRGRNKPLQKTLGTEYASWLSMFNADKICLYLADFDPTAAYEYYWHVDLDWVQASVRLKSEWANQCLISSMEAVLYGTGGKYSNDVAASGGKAMDFDLSSGEGFSELSKFGFM